MKVFGKKLFEFKVEKPLVPLYNFAQHGILRGNWEPSELRVTMNEHIAELEARATGAKVKKEKPKKVKPEVTPKELYKLSALNDNNFSINATDEYIEEQVSLIDMKLALFGLKPKGKKTTIGNDIVQAHSSEELEWGGVKYGRQELESVRERLLNRRKIAQFQDILDKYPHTTSALIQKVMSEHKHLASQVATEFVPDFPKEAVQAMSDYTEATKKLCGKLPVFYVIANKKDFEKKNERRDPILLAQSPFGHFWQILGAWDEEMVHLADL